MEKFMKRFKDESLEKFNSMDPEVSEIFRKQTMFKDFEIDADFVSFSGESGVKVVEESSRSYVRDLKGGDMRPYLKYFDVYDKFAQMNNAFFNSGIVVDVKKNESAGTLRIKSEPFNEIFSKIVVVAREGSSIDIVKESYSPSKDGHVVSEDVTVIAHAGSNVTFSELQNYNQLTTYMSNKVAHCDAGSRVSWNVGVFGGARNRTRTYNFLNGEGAEAEDLQLTFGDGKQMFDSFSSLIHVGRSTSGKSMSKGAFKDGSNSISKGMIKIGCKAKNANSYLASHGMLIGKLSKANVIPSLEIETNDVKATHAASVSPIDDEKIFYMTSRGIDADSARKMVTLGFFDPLVTRISSKDVKAKIRYLIDSKWSGDNSGTFDEKRLRDYMTEDAIKSGGAFEGHYKYR